MMNRPPNSQMPTAPNPANAGGRQGAPPSMAPPKPPSPAIQATTPQAMAQMNSMPPAQMPDHFEQLAQQAGTMPPPQGMAPPSPMPQQNMAPPAAMPAAGTPMPNPMGQQGNPPPSPEQQQMMAQMLRGQ